jgi:CDP-diacylglycerol--serine O-phosphatidyltransferase
MNVMSGACSIFLAMYGYLMEAALLILLAMVFDFFDGFAARLLHAKSDIGKELDSLADVVSFGVAPAVLAHFLMLRSLSGGTMEYFGTWNWGEKAMLFTPLLMPAFSAYRLAKFNLDVRQTTSFIGLPTPANALFWVALVFGCFFVPNWYGCLFDQVYVLGGCVLLLSVLLVSELPMFSLKVKGLGWKENQVRYLYFLLLALLAFCLGKAVVMLVIPLYILWAVIQALRNRMQGR